MSIIREALHIAGIAKRPTYVVKKQKKGEKYPTWKRRLPDPGVDIKALLEDDETVIKRCDPDGSLHPTNPDGTNAE